MVESWTGCLSTLFTRSCCIVLKLRLRAFEPLYLRTRVTSEHVLCMYEYNEGPCTGEHLGRGSRNGLRVYRGHRSTYTTNEQTFVRVLLSLSLSLTLCDHPLTSLSLCHSLHTDPHSLLTAALSSHSILFAEILRGYDCIPAGSLLRLRSRTPARKRKCSCEISRRKGLVTRGCKCHSSAHGAITIATMQVANSCKRENVS